MPGAAHGRPRAAVGLATSGARRPGARHRYRPGDAHARRARAEPRTAAGALRRGAPVVVNLSIAIDGVFSEGDLVQTVQRRVAPILAQTIEDNVAGSRTRFQDVLGVP